MKLDRNINKDQKGKYALICLRHTKLSVPEIRRIILGNIGGSVFQAGDIPSDEFFVIKLKDVFAEPALRAYADAARPFDPEYAKEIDALADRAKAHPFKRQPD